MGKLYEQISQYMAEAELNVDGDPENGVLLCTIGGDDASFLLHMLVKEEEDGPTVVLHSQLPVRIPEEGRLKAAELLTRINYDLRIGNFEIGLDDGEVMFKTSVDLVDAELTKAMFMRLYDLNIQTMNLHMKRIIGVGFHSVSAVEVLETARPDGVVLQ